MANWKQKEIQYLQENWGTKSITSISKHLSRSVTAIRLKAQRLQLGTFLQSGDYVTFNELYKTMFGHNTHSYQITSWIKNRDFPVHKIKLIDKVVRIVYIDEFWDWAKENRSFLDFSKTDIGFLGAEPDWVNQQRKNDFASCRLQRKDRWSVYEDEYLLSLVKMQKFTCSEISEKLNRSEGAIVRRLTDLGVKERPIKRDNHGENCKWQAKDYEVLCEEIKNGTSYSIIGRKLGKSEKSVRGKVYLTYFTESQDKVRKYIGTGKWGDGAPIPTVRQALHISHNQKETKSLLEEFASVLYHRTVELKKDDYDYFFQRKICENWNELNGMCSVGEIDCDRCNKFTRMQPQYCKRCGITFYEKKANLFCASCRSARRKQAQRKFAILKKRL